MYINAGRTGFARALAAETPILCVGADVAAAATPQSRFALARSVATLAEGIATLTHLRDGELAVIVASVLRAIDVQLPPLLVELVVGEDNAIAERAKVLKKELSRRAKAAVVQLAAKPNDLVDVEAFKRAALAVGHRAGLLWSGDLAVALAVLDVGKGGRALTDSPAALDLCAWSVSEAHARLRDRLGLAAKGTR